MTTATGFAHPEYLVDAAWVETHKADPNLVIVDCDVEPAYNRGHIPGAVLVPDNYEKDPDTGRIHIMPPDKFAAMSQGLGIGDQTLVVAYDNSQSLYAARLWWALNYYGHTSVKVLDGGWRRWVSEGRQVSFARPNSVGSVKFTPKANASIITKTDELKTNCRLSDVVVWDVRSAGEYDGSNSRGNKRVGHVPGAVHLEWLNVMDRDTHRFKPAADIQRMLTQKGITPEKRVYTY
ncbi:MAG: sulfurtransferase [SAR202 cluster bacterium]|nr:sulfurtransferase [SAR202 cluster bacterium]